MTGKLTVIPKWEASANAAARVSVPATSDSWTRLHEGTAGAIPHVPSCPVVSLVLLSLVRKGIAWF